MSSLFSFGQRLGIFITVLASTLSAISVIGLLVSVVIRKIRRWRFHHLARHTGGSLDASPFILLVSLVVADLVQAIGGMPSWRWMLDAHLTEGSLCTFQSLFLNVGNVAIALSVLSIALHTFLVLILQWRFTRKTLRIVVAGIWCLTALIVGICNRGQKDYYGGTGYWCWITEKYSVERIMGEYLWLWTSFFAMIALYIFMFLVMRGIVKMPNDTADGVMTEEEEEEKRESKEIAYLMLFYPAVYLVCIAPVSISRWIAWGNKNHPGPPAATIYSNAIFSLSGVFNVTLFTLTRPTLVRGSVESLANNVEMHSCGPAGPAAGPLHCHCNCHSQVSGPPVAKDATDPTPNENHHQSQSQGPTLPMVSTHMKHTAYLQSHSHVQLPD